MRTIRSIQGQVVAEIDPMPYRDKVNIAQAQLDSAQAELARQRADLDRVRKEVPIQIEIARRTAAAAVADRAKGRGIPEADHVTTSRRASTRPAPASRRRRPRSRWPNSSTHALPGSSSKGRARNSGSSR